MENFGGQYQLHAGMVWNVEKEVDTVACYEMKRKEKKTHHSKH